MHRETSAPLNGKGWKLDATTTAIAAVAVSGVNTMIVIGVLIFKGGSGYKQELAGVESRITQTIAEVEKDLASRSDEGIKQVGESLKAIREQIVRNLQAAKDADAQLLDHVRRVEIWARDRFIDKDDFEAVITRIETSVREHGGRAELSISQLRTDILALVSGKIKEAK